MHTVRDKKKSGAYAATSSSLSIPGWTHLLMGKLFFFMLAGIMGNILFCFMDADRHVLSSMLHASPTHFAFAMLCIGKTTLRPCPTDHAWPQTSAAETVMVCKKEQEYFEYLYVVALLQEVSYWTRTGIGQKTVMVMDLSPRALS